MLDRVLQTPISRNGCDDKRPALDLAGCGVGGYDWGMESERDKASENPYESPLLGGVMEPVPPKHPDPLAPSRRDWVLSITIASVLLILRWLFMEV